MDANGYSYAETQQILYKTAKSIRFKYEAIDGVMMMGMPFTG
jgi:hypothetical protein